MNYEELENAVNVFGLIGLDSKEDIKQKYLKLSKEFHPDMPNGSTEKFQEINKSYKILIAYIEKFKFKFTKEEFQDQYPFLKKSNGSWSLW